MTRSELPTSSLSLPPTACVDWAERLQRGAYPMATERLPMLTPAAERFSRTFARLVVPDLDGQPFAGDTPTQKWLDAVARALFGGTEIREALVLIGKKNAKTSGGALMFLTAFLLNKVGGQRFTILAPTVGVATLAFEQIANSLEADPELHAKVRIRRHVREIDHLNTNSMIMVKPSSLAAVTGLKGYVLVDELHLWGQMSQGQRLRQQLRGALAVNPQAKALYVTTQSDEPPEGLFATMLAYARGIRDGRIVDPSFLPVTFEPWKGCEPWHDESVWPALLPAYPHVADRAFYRAAIAEANAGSLSMQAEAKSQFFNVQIGQSDTADQWTLAAKYAGLCAPFDLDEVIEESERVAVGIDLGGADDLTSFVALGVGYDGLWRTWTRSWLTPAGWQRNVRNQARFQGWVDKGDLVRVEPGGDVEQAVGLCEQVRDSGKLTGVGVDPAGAADLADALEATGFVMEKDLHGVGQSAFRLAPAVRTLDRRAERGTVLFADQALMAWALRNVVVKQKGNAPSIDKQYALDKIDPVMALLDAVTIEIHHRPDVVDVAGMVG